MIKKETKENRMNELTIADVVVKDGFFIRKCGNGACLSQRQDGVIVDIVYKSALDTLVTYLKTWYSGIIL